MKPTLQESIEWLTGLKSVIGEDGQIDCLLEALAGGEVARPIVAYQAQLNGEWHTCSKDEYERLSGNGVIALRFIEGGNPQSDMQRLIIHAAEIAVSIVQDDSDFANDSWRSLPDHLQVAINVAQERIEKERREL